MYGQNFNIFSFIRDQFEKNIYGECVKGKTNFHPNETSDKTVGKKGWRWQFNPIWIYGQKLDDNNGAKRMKMTWWI